MFLKKGGFLMISNLKIYLPLYALCIFMSVEGMEERSIVQGKVEINSFDEIETMILPPETEHFTLGGKVNEFIDLSSAQKLREVYILRDSDLEGMRLPSSVKKFIVGEKVDIKGVLDLSLISRSVDVNICSNCKIGKIIMPGTVSSCTEILPIVESAVDVIKQLSDQV
jgi:5S rRNA maturation endonuclease (ribonuclease M5)